MANFEVWGSYEDEEGEFCSVSLYVGVNVSDVVDWAKKYCAKDSGGYDSVFVCSADCDDEIIWSKSFVD